MAPSGDLNGDGVPDLVVGGFAHGNDRGVAYVVYGPVQGEVDLANADATLVGRPGDWAGGEVAVGDVNGDGIDDVVIGATKARVGTLDQAGVAYVVYGPVAGAIDLQAAGAVLTGADTGAWAGYALGPMLDVNRDGCDDVLVGAPNAGGVGEAYVVYGPIHGPLSLRDADLVLVGENVNDGAGESLAVGDVDGDGALDVVVGADQNVGAGRFGSGATYVVRGIP